MTPSLRLFSTPCRHLALRLARPVPLGGSTLSTWTPAPYQHTTTRSILQLSRREKDLHAIQETSGLLSEKEKRILATKEAKRAKWAERMQSEHGEKWEAVVEERDRAEVAARQRGEKPASKKKNRWTQQQKDEAAVKRAETQAAKERSKV